MERRTADYAWPGKERGGAILCDASDLEGLCRTDCHGSSGDGVVA